MFFILKSKIVSRETNEHNLKNAWKIFLTYGFE